MRLSAHAQARPGGELVLWVGVFGAAEPPLPRFVVAGVASAALAPLAWFPIRDGKADAAGRPLNHQLRARLPMPDTADRFEVRVEIDGAAPCVFRSAALPTALSTDRERPFNLLLCSCYFQPNDKGTRLGDIVRRLPQPIDLTLMAGDQVYLDLPTGEDLPNAEPALSQALGRKYERNWTASTLVDSHGRSIPGLDTVLQRAPVVCLPDDHEYWNNFPFFQAQLGNLYSAAGRNRWRDAAQALFEDYQLGGAPGDSATRELAMAPLRMLFIDLRSRRDANLVDMTDAAGEQALRGWTERLIADRRNGPAIGLLSSGQALLIDTPGAAARHVADAEMSNYAQFALIRKCLGELADAGVPVLYLTGDVHWSRVARATDAGSGRDLLFEVIASPSRLIDTVGSDQWHGVVDAVKGVFGARDPWPRHGSAPKDILARFGDGGRFRPTEIARRRGDCVAVVSLSRRASSVDLTVTYYAVHDDPAIAAPVVIGPITLLAD